MSQPILTRDRSLCPEIRGQILAWKFGAGSKEFVSSPQFEEDSAAFLSCSECKAYFR